MAQRLLESLRFRHWPDGLRPNSRWLIEIRLDTTSREWRARAFQTGLFAGTGGDRTEVPFQRVPPLAFSGPRSDRWPSFARMHPARGSYFSELLLHQLVDIDVKSG